MKYMLFALALAVLPAPGEVSDNHPAPPLALYTKFSRTPPAGVVSALRMELAGILNPTGLEFDWRSLDRGRTSEVSVELVVVSFVGPCTADGAPDPEQRGGPLGWTHTSNGQVLPFAVVDCGRIRGLLRRALAALPAGRREATLGRAIARVMAHEVYHAVAKTRRHGAEGVAKPVYSVRELTAAEFQFEEANSDALRHSDAFLALENAETPAGH